MLQKKPMEVSQRWFTLAPRMVAIEEVAYLITGTSEEATRDWLRRIEGERGLKLLIDISKLGSKKAVYRVDKLELRVALTRPSEIDDAEQLLDELGELAETVERLERRFDDALDLHWDRARSRALEALDQSVKSRMEGIRRAERLHARAVKNLCAKLEKATRTYKGLRTSRKSIA